VSLFRQDSSAGGLERASCEALGGVAIGMCGVASVSCQLSDTPDALRFAMYDQ